MNFMSWRIERRFMGTNRMTDDGKPWSLGTVTFPYHSRWHIERTLSPTAGDGIPGRTHGGQALYPWAIARSGVFKISIYIFFMENETKDFVWHNFYSGSCYLDCLFWFVFILLGQLAATQPLLIETSYSDWLAISVEETFPSPEHSATCSFPGSAFDWK